MSFQKVFLFLVIMTTYVMATPTWMYLGTYGIQNGPCPPYLSNAYPAIQGFYEDALEYHPDNPTPIQYIHWCAGYEGEYVNPSVLNDNDREYCDFLYFFMHGSPHDSRRSIYVWNNENTEGINFPTSELHFGTFPEWGTQGYVRWVFFDACNVLHYDGFDNFFDGWRPSFAGVQCIIGYGSESKSNQASTTQNEIFWSSWTNQTTPYSIWNAHNEAIRQVQWETLHWGIMAACVCSRRAGSPPHHYYYADSYSEATSEAGVPWPVLYAWHRYGTPTY